MKATDIRVSTTTEPSAGIVAAAKFYPYPTMINEQSLEMLNGLDFSDEIEQLQAQARKRKACAVTGISFQVNNLPGGIYVIATGTLSEA